MPLRAAGASRYISGLLHGLASVDSRNEYFIFLKATHNGMLESLPMNIRLVTLPNLARPARMIYQHLLAGVHAQRLQLEVWHGMHYSLPHLARRMALIATFHDMSYFEFPGYFSKSRLFYFRRVMADAVHRANMIVCVSHATREALYRYFPVNGRAITVHSGVEPVFFNRLSVEKIDRTCSALQVPRPYILFLSTIESHKNLPLALQALALIRRHNLHMVIAGQPGSGWPEASALIRKLDLTESVHCLGYVAEEKLPALYQGARVLVVPSIVEGFGFPALEAMAGGIPVLAAQPSNSPHSAQAEVVSHPAMLCDHDPERWAAQMEKLIYNEPLRRELSAYAIERAAQFSWETTARRMVDIYESAVSDRTHRPSNGANKTNGTADPIETKIGKAQHLGKGGYLPDMIVSAVLRTLIYADMFDYPLQQREIHRGLLECVATPDEVSAALAMLCRHQLIAHTGEWWHLPGRDMIVGERQRRGEYTRNLWRQNAGLLKAVCRFPFVKAVAISGAGAFENCKTNDDIDLFVIADHSRLWLAYAGLVLMLKMLGKRKLICLNYLIGHRELAVAPGRDRDFFVAHQIGFLRPLRGQNVFDEFFQANDWIQSHLPEITSSSSSTIAGAPAVPAHPWLGQRLIEGILHLRVFDRLEQIIFRAYRRRIMRLAGHHGSDAIEATPGRIKLFTHNHRFRLRQTLEKRFDRLWEKYLKTTDKNSTRLQNPETMTFQTQEGLT